MLDLTVEGSIARLRFSRPEARNAIPLAGWNELASAAEQAVAQGAQVLIVSGTRDGAFCAGADISDFDGFRGNAEARTRFRTAIRDGLNRLAALSIPTIALVEGACYGAGVAVAMACDIRIASASARFAITPAKLGISYPQEDVHRLVSLVGPGQASRLLFSAGSIDGAEAARIGLADIFAEDAEGAALNLAREIAANDSESLRTLKRSIRLAAAGASQDGEQDRAFDDLLGAEALFERLETYRGRRR